MPAAMTGKEPPALNRTALQQRADVGIASGNGNRHGIRDACNRRGY
jgi:hypothetical protein